MYICTCFVKIVQNMTPSVSVMYAHQTMLTKMSSSNSSHHVSPHVLPKFLQVLSPVTVTLSTMADHGPELYVTLHLQLRNLYLNCPTVA